MEKIKSLEIINISKSFQSVIANSDINISIGEGHELVQLPEGASYLGFIFARAPTAVEVESALRAAHAQLKVIVRPLWKIESEK